MEFFYFFIYGRFFNGFINLLIGSILKPFGPNEHAYLNKYGYFSKLEKAENFKEKFWTGKFKKSLIRKNDGFNLSVRSIYNPKFYTVLKKRISLKMLTI